MSINLRDVEVTREAVAIETTFLYSSDKRVACLIRYEVTLRDKATEAVLAVVQKSVRLEHDEVVARGGALIAPMADLLDIVIADTERDHYGEV